MPYPFHFSPVIREWSKKKTPIEKTRYFKDYHLSLIVGVNISFEYSGKDFLTKGEMPSRSPYLESPNFCPQPKI